MSWEHWEEHVGCWENFADKNKFREMLLKYPEDKIASDPHIRFLAEDIERDIKDELNARCRFLEDLPHDSMSDDIHVSRGICFELMDLTDGKPTPLIDRLCDLKLIRKSLSDYKPYLDTFIKIYGPDAGL